jgi:signal transduction histidine kinase/sugar lactone lactonase YvrE
VSFTRKRCAVLVGLLLFLSVSLPALDPSLAVSQYARKHWQVEDGLPQNYVTSLTEDADGLLMVGTSGGVARFDGIDFQPIVLDEQTGISREWINGVAVDGAGRLWMASRDAGLYLHKDGVSRQVLNSDITLASLVGFPDGSVAAIGAGVWFFENETPVRIADGGAGDLSWESLLLLPDGRRLACHPSGVHVYEGRNRSLVFPTSPSTGRPLSLHRGASGRVYVGTTSGLIVLNVAAPSKFQQVMGVGGPVVSVVEDRDGQIWAATWGNGLYRVWNSRVEQITDPLDLPDTFIHTLYEDREGSLWIGTRTGLSRWRSSSIVPYGPREGLGAQFLSVVAGDGVDGLWIGSWRTGLHHLRAGSFTKLDLGDQESTTLISVVAVAPDGSLWYADWQKLNHSRNGKVHSFLPEQLGHTSRVLAILFDRKGRMWLGHVDGVDVYESADITAPYSRKVQAHHVRCLLEARDGSVWVGTRTGLIRIVNGKEEYLSGLPHPDVTALHQDRHGRIWVATRGNGLALVEGETLRVFDQRHGLPALPVFAMQHDADGDLWFSSPAGLFSIRGNQLDALASGTTQQVNPTSYGAEDGLRTVEFQNAGFPTSWKDQNGSLWFASVQGLVEVRPRQLHSLPPPSVIIREVRSHNRSNEVSFTTNRLANASSMQFRYRVDDLQQDWISLGGQRVLRLDNLQAGRHYVRLAARELGGEWGPEASFWIEQPPRWFETWWFRLLLALTLAGLLWGAYRWRMLIVKSRYAAILTERSRIAREWHDTLLAGFSAISWQLDATSKLVHQQPEAASQSIELARNMVKHYRAEARRVIWDLREDQSDFANLAEAIQAASDALTRDTPAKVFVATEGELPDLPSELRLNLLRIAQEAMGNAIHHASPSRVDVRLQATGDAIELTVIDDGCGFDPGGIHPGHFGMAIMKERAEKFGGHVVVDSKLGGGTAVRAWVPWK